MKNQAFSFLFICIFTILHLSTFGQNVGIGTLMPEAKLHIKGAVDVSQFIIDANLNQSNFHPLIKLRDSSGADLMWINSDNSTNVFVGFRAGRLNAGFSNTFIGGDAGYASAVANYNTACGESALFNNTEGSSNTAIGEAALLSNTTGSKNTAVGKFAGSLGGNLSNATSIGYNSQAGLSNTLVLGGTGVDAVNVGIGTTTPASLLSLESNNTGQTGINISNTSTGGIPYIMQTVGSGNAGRIGNFEIWRSDFGINVFTIQPSGHVGIGTTNPTQFLTVYNGSTTGTYTITGWMHSSDARLKTNIKPIDGALNKIMNLQGVSYNWISSPNDNDQIGFIAQDVEKIFPEVIVKDEEGNYSMAPQNLTAPIVEAIKEQQAQINSLMDALNVLKTTINSLQSENADLVSRLNKIDNVVAEVKP